MEVATKNKGPQQPEQGKQSRTVWNVLVRHSPLLVKQAEIEAATPEEARQIFLGMAKDRMENIALNQKGPEAMKAAARIRAGYQEALARVDTLDWDIRPIAEVRAERDAIKQRREKVWGTPEGAAK